jgi:hypothetical protein
MSPVKQPLVAPTMFMHPLGTPSILPASTRIAWGLRKKGDATQLRRLTKDCFIRFTLAFEEWMQIVNISLSRRKQ